MAGADGAGVLKAGSVARGQRLDNAVADPEDARASNASSPPASSLQRLRRDRYVEVARVLVRVLVLNLGVALAKIAFGYASGAISILSDGFHSLTDAASNVVGLVGVRAPGGRPTRIIPTATGSTRRSRPRRSRCSCCS